MTSIELFWKSGHDGQFLWQISDLTYDQIQYGKICTGEVLYDLSQGDRAQHFQILLYSSADTFWT